LRLFENRPLAIFTTLSLHLWQSEMHAGADTDRGMASLGASANPLRAACAAVRSLPARLLRGVPQPGSGSLLALVAILSSGGISAGSQSVQIPSCALEVPPSEQLGELFQQVQLKHIFPDSKTFADLLPDEAPNAILAEYQARKDEAGFDLSAFVNRHFSMPAEGPDVRPALPGERLERCLAGRQMLGG
jgi:hypothetical protein